MYNVIYEDATSVIGNINWVFLDQIPDRETAQRIADALVEENFVKHAWIKEV